MIKMNARPVILIAKNAKTSLNVQFARIISSYLTISVLKIVPLVCIRTPITHVNLARLPIAINAMKKNA